MAKLHFHDINAFARHHEPVIGNPASICLVDHFPSDDVMGRAAYQLRTPMTSFVCRTADPMVFDIRHFSPDGKENHVCGHATLAAAELVARFNPAARLGGDLTFRLNPRYAINAANAFYAHIDGNDITLTVPAVTEMQRVDNPDFYKRLAEGLCISESDIVKPSYYVPRIINYVVELKDQDTLIDMKPDFAKLKTLAASVDFPHEGIMATTPSKTNGFDIMTRVFLPIIDVDEDVVCGSANCSVAPYWAMKRPGVFATGKTAFRAMFPYPPRMGDGVIGGVQDLLVDLDAGTVKIKGQAVYDKEQVLNIPSRPRGSMPSL